MNITAGHELSRLLAQIVGAENVLTGADVYTRDIKESLPLPDTKEDY